MTHNYLERLFTKKCDKKLITGMPRQEAHNNNWVAVLPGPLKGNYLETDCRRQRTNTMGEVGTETSQA